MVIFDELSTALGHILQIIWGRLFLLASYKDGVYSMFSWPYLAIANLTGSVVVPPMILVSLVGGVLMSIQKHSSVI